MFSRTSIKQGRNESNPVIYPGDLIIVDKAAPVYFTGMVVQQTGIYIKDGGLSLTRAIAMVGGVREKAKTKDVKIYRLVGDNKRDRKTISVNLNLIKNGKQDDIMLEPYDIIEVDRARDSIGKTILDIVTGAARTGVSSFATGGARILY
jgi:protein involved in polysaccharide export with SLBB domain